MSVIPMYLLVFATHLLIAAQRIFDFRDRHKRKVGVGEYEAKA